MTSSASWSIQNVKERQKRVEQADIKGFAEKYQCSIEEFAKRGLA